MATNQTPTATDLDTRAAREIRVLATFEDNGAFGLTRRAGHIEVTEVSGRVIHVNITNHATGETFTGVTAAAARSALRSASRNVIIDRDRAARLAARFAA